MGDKPSHMLTHPHSRDGGSCVSETSEGVLPPALTVTITRTHRQEPWRGLERTPHSMWPKQPTSSKELQGKSLDWKRDRAG